MNSKRIISNSTPGVDPIRQLSIYNCRGSLLESCEAFLVASGTQQHAPKNEVVNTRSMNVPVHL